MKQLELSCSQPISSIKCSGQKRGIVIIITMVNMVTMVTMVIMVIMVIMATTWC